MQLISSGRFQGIVLCLSCSDWLPFGTINTWTEWAVETVHLKVQSPDCGLLSCQVLFVSPEYHPSLCLQQFTTGFHAAEWDRYKSVLMMVKKTFSWTFGMTSLKSHHVPRTGTVRHWKGSSRQLKEATSIAQTWPGFYFFILFLFMYYYSGGKTFLFKLNKSCFLRWLEATGPQ